MPPADALQFLLKGDQIQLNRAKAMKLIDAVVPPATSSETARTGSRPAATPRRRGTSRVSSCRAVRSIPRAGMMTFPPANAIYRRETYDNYPAARAIMQVVYEGLQLPIDQALRVELRWFAKILRSPEAAAMIRSLFVSMQELNKGARRPAGVPPAAQENRRDRRRLHGRRHRLCECARRHRRRADRPRPETAEKGKAHSQKLMPNRSSAAAPPPPTATRCWRASQPTADYVGAEGLRSCHRGRVRGPQGQGRGDRRAQNVIGRQAIFGSNTSTLADHLAGRRVQGPRRASSASISSRRSSA